jgi:hypothetical protein
VCLPRNIYRRFHPPQLPIAPDAKKATKANHLSNRGTLWVLLGRDARQRRPRVLERTAKQFHFISFALKARFRRCFTLGAGGFFLSGMFFANCSLRKAMDGTTTGYLSNCAITVLTEVD